MAELALIAGIASTAMTAVGTIAAGQAAKEQGELSKRASDFEAKQLDIKAKEEKAAGQREMFELRREKDVALSRLQTVGAASGFTATDPTALALADEVAKYGTYREQLAMFGGTQRERDLELAAAGRRFEGEQARLLGSARQRSSYFDAGGTILGGLSTMATKYAKRSSGSTAAYRYG